MFYAAKSQTREPFPSAFTLLLALGLSTVSPLLTNSARGQAWTWTQCTNAPSLEWRAVACSSDGTKIFAAVENGGIYRSTNSGATWNATTAPLRNWDALASSADGTKVAAGISTLSSTTNGGIWASIDGGNTWTNTMAISNLYLWLSIASSSNGNLIAGGDGDINGQAAVGEIFTSFNSGNMWNLNSPMSTQWSGVTSSADGTKLAAVPYTNLIYVSTNSGTTWTSNAFPLPYGWCIAFSGDGTKLAVGTTTAPIGSIFTSTNRGSTWVSNTTPNGAWYSIAASSNGNILAAASPTIIATTTNFGQNWLSNNLPSETFLSIAMSSDGSRLVTVALNGPIYAATVTPPLLSASRTGSNLALGWSNSVFSFQLQQNFGLSSNGWTAVTNAVTLTNGKNQVSVATTNHQTFYRLQYQ
jgi:hypothetical protein